jgi:hypothetical protein
MECTRISTRAPVKKIDYLIGSWGLCAGQWQLLAGIDSKRERDERRGQSELSYSTPVRYRCQPASEKKVIPSRGGAFTFRLKP